MQIISGRMTWNPPSMWNKTNGNNL